MRGLAARLPAALTLTSVLITAASALPAATVPQSALQTCADIAADAGRLACYDRLAGRAAQSGTVPASASTAATPAARAPTPAAVSAAAAAPVAAAVSAAAPTPAPLPQESFGLYEAEHPKLPATAMAASLEARVVALGKSASGRMTVSLEGGAEWELDQADPLLAVGQTVTITRASLGSYLLSTATRRTHRARRLH